MRRWGVLAAAFVLAACGSESTDSDVTAGTSVGPTTTAVADAPTSTTVPTTSAVTTTTVVPTTTTGAATTTDAPTTTVAATTTEAPTTTEAATTTEAPTTTVPAPLTDAVLVGAFGAAGMWDAAAGLWRDDIEFAVADVPVAPGDTFAVFDLTGVIGSATAGAVDLTCETAGVHGPSLDPDLTFEFDSGVNNPLAVSAAPNRDPHVVQPRPAEVLDPASAEWVAPVQAQLDAAGIGGSPVNVVHVVRGDLDGDGAAETVIVAESGMEVPMVAPPAGSYALVIVLRPDGGEVLTSVLESVVFLEDQEFPNFVNYRVQSLVDLNGDGVMEVVVEYIAWESAGVDVFEVLPGADSERVLSGGCGS